MNVVQTLTGIVLISLGSAGFAQDSPLCSDRPGKASPTCVMQPGRLQIETSLIDWTHDLRDGARSDNLLFGDSLLKYGVGYETEVRIGLTPYAHDRVRTGSGVVMVAEGFGDLGLSARHRFIDGGGKRMSLAVIPFALLPIGSRDVSAGTWSAGVAVPVDIPVPGGWALNVTPTIAASADGDGNGRHVQYSGVVAATHSLAGNMSGTVELFAQRDRDPAGHNTQATADFLLAYAAGPNTQFDVSTYVGLNRQTPDVELLGGFTRRF